jgi:hypothetical protein
LVLLLLLLLFGFIIVVIVIVILMIVVLCHSSSWGRAVLPLVVDREVAVQEEAVSQGLRVFVQPWLVEKYVCLFWLFLIGI